MAVIAYLRVSTADQSTESQRHTIEERHRVDRWFTDEAVSGAVNTVNRPGFAQCLDYLRDGDTLLVPAIDRLGRSTVDVLNTVETLQAKGVTVLSLREGFDLSTPIGKAMLTMLAAVAELERNNIKERQAQGIAAAKAQGKHLGRPRDHDHSEIQRRLRAGESKSAIAKALGCGRATVYRVAKKYPSL